MLCKLVKAMMAYSDLLLVLKSFEELEFGGPLSTDLPTLIAACHRCLEDDPAATDARQLLHLLQAARPGKFELPASARARDRRSPGHAG